MKKRTVALVGGNLVISAIAACLQEKPEFEVQRIAEPFSDLIDRIKGAPPDVILFNLDEGNIPFAIPLLRNHPKIMLIGVDLIDHKMLMLSGEQSRLLTEQDLMRVIGGDGS